MKARLDRLARLMRDLLDALASIANKGAGFSVPSGTVDARETAAKSLAASYLPARPKFRAAAF